MSPRSDCSVMAGRVAVAVLVVDVAPVFACRRDCVYSLLFLVQVVPRCFPIVLAVPIAANVCNVLRARSCLVEPAQRAAVADRSVTQQVEPAKVWKSVDLVCLSNHCACLSETGCSLRSVGVWLFVICILVLICHRTQN